MIISYYCYKNKIKSVMNAEGSAGGHLSCVQKDRAGNPERSGELLIFFLIFFLGDCDSACAETETVNQFHYSEEDGLHKRVQLRGCF